MSALDLIDNGDTVTMSRERQMLALECAWELEKLSQVIAKILPIDDSQDFFAIRGIAARIKQLSVVSMKCLSEEDEATRDLSYTVRLELEPV